MTAAAAGVTAGAATVDGAGAAIAVAATAAAGIEPRGLGYRPGMNLLGWIVVGLLAGGLARRAVGAPKRGCLATIAIGVLGALVGGALFRFATGDPVDAFDEFDLASILVAFLGAAALLLVLEAVGGKPHRRRSLR